LASDDDPAPTSLLAFTRVDLDKRRSAMAKSNAGKANLPLIDAQKGRKTMSDLTNTESTLDQFAPHNSDSEDDFEPSMLNDEVDNALTAPFVASQPGGVSDLIDVNRILNDWIKYEQHTSNEHLILLL